MLGWERMRWFGFALVFSISLALISLSASAQQPESRAEAARVTDTQAVAVFNAISQHMARLEPMVEQVRVKDWVAKGAPDAYVRQLAHTTGEIQAIQSEMARIAQHPDQMQECMRALFQVQGLHIPLDSLMAGLRKYQNPALADLIESVAAEDETQITQFEKYVLQLADDKDQQYQVVDSEAQRCRATLSRQPAPRPKATHN